MNKTIAIAYLVLLPLSAAAQRWSIQPQVNLPITGNWTTTYDFGMGISVQHFWPLQKHDRFAVTGQAGYNYFINPTAYQLHMTSLMAGGRILMGKGRRISLEGALGSGLLIERFDFPLAQNRYQMTQTRLRPSAKISAGYKVLGPVDVQAAWQQMIAEGGSLQFGLAWHF